MNNKIIIVLITIILITHGKRHFIENKIHNKQELDGGIKWESPESFHNDEDYQKAINQARHEFHHICHLSIDVTWIRVDKVGFQIVAGVMWWLEVELSDDEVYEMKVYQELEGTFKLVGCTK
ncbi:unnamed protein product [Paramecium primaurelia]|uniref:Cystatin domain-containing protein n=1 Tax=Paramecium primaurelia TaxID=5886 RepID=A0A8S1QAI8_PARPR|nr:unnamed protein product [Paramecium primaurelia]